MPSPAVRHLSSACLRLLRPLARILIRHGLSAHEFGRLANIAFIQGAMDILREQGQPVNFSRISAITGLHRHVVATLAGEVTAAAGALPVEKDYQRNRLARVLTGWFETPAYTDSQGRPLPLPLTGPTPSFRDLVREFSGDIYPGIILDELLRVGAARLQDDGTICAVSQRYTVGGADPQALAHLGAVARDVLGTLEYNLSAPLEQRLFEDTVVAPRFSVRALPLLRQVLRQRASSALHGIEGWLLEHDNKENQKSVRAGVAVQVFIDNGPDES